jgi:chemotaxis protein methyltransferase CheR
MADFFQNQHYLEYLVNEALPELVRSYGYGLWKTLMVWSPKCFSGEGPYTLAMVLSEFATRYPGLGFDFTIVATDVSTQIIDIARRGVYDENTIKPVPLALRKKYLLKSKDRSRQLVRIAPELQEMVKFRTGDLLKEDLQFREPLDIIYCPEVPSNMDSAIIKHLFTKFYRYLSPGGYLFFGHQLPPRGLPVALAQVAPRIYRKPNS